MAEGGHMDWYDRMEALANSGPPTIAEAVVNDVLSELNGRKGFDSGVIDPETGEELLRTLIDRVDGILAIPGPWR